MVVIVMIVGAMMMTMTTILHVAEYLIKFKMS